MTDLIAELERASEGSRDLSMKVCAAIGDGYQKSLAEAILRSPKAYESADLSPKLFVTQSLDAALQLVPEGWRKEILDWPDGAAHRGGAALEYLYDNKHPRRIPANGYIWAATPALALCIAALRAREEVGG